jgi:AraC family transcriptional regulator of adaptative response/methylated-DNA-[protein]-cysteine methyltransferase
MNMVTRNEMLAAQTLDDPRWQAVVARDSSADGKFLYSVRTTGVYCRPSCAARAARPENVAFYATAADAERAGFRPCKRCKPNQPSRAQLNAEAVAELCRFIENADAPPTLNELSRHAGLSAFHLHRVFKEVTGVTPHAYAAAHGVNRLRDALERDASVTDAISGEVATPGSRL